jgi:glutamyl-tRNA reductase
MDAAELFARRVDGYPVNYMDDGLTAMRGADIVISATDCPVPILDTDDIAAVMRFRPHCPLLVIDAAAPRDVRPAVQNIENVFLYNLDHLEQLVQENARRRETELDRCRKILAKYMAPVRKLGLIDLPDSEQAASAPAPSEIFKL